MQRLLRIPKCNYYHRLPRIVSSPNNNIRSSIRHLSTYLSQLQKQPLAGPHSGAIPRRLSHSFSIAATTVDRERMRYTRRRGTTTFPWALFSCYYYSFFATTTTTNAAAYIPPFMRDNLLPGTAAIHNQRPVLTSCLLQQQNSMGAIRTATTTTAAAAAGNADAATAADASATAATGVHPTLRPIYERLINSWPRQLSPETLENLKRSRERERLSLNDNDNRQKRPVYNGHYVLVHPTGLSNPRMVLVSTSTAEMLGLTPEITSSDAFCAWVAGHADTVLPGSETWATPYALSIMGTRYTNNCPYGTGDGYGDGRAISIGELAVVPSAALENGNTSASAPRGYELQLKGAGKTPFCRGGDGRAVLRSSIREFLASEAMHHLGVSTTRALSLTVSQDETVQRPWYSPQALLRVPKIDDARLAQYPLEQRQQLLQQLRNQKVDPNILIPEYCAITCRVAQSFVRIGHVDLFARRVDAQATETADGKTIYKTDTLQWKEYEQMIWHACYREYKSEAYDPFIEQNDIKGAATVLLQQAAERIATMVSEWVRVGFAQGNFNADNCLVAGRTMDYGPFGWIEEYNPLFAKWTGSGPHFGFMNQPNAGFANYNVLVASVAPVLVAGTDQTPDEVIASIVEPAARLFEQKVDAMFRRKLGFATDQDVGDALWEVLEPLMRKSRIDWTLCFRQLTYVAQHLIDHPDATAETMLAMIEGNETEREGSSAFYEPLSETLREEWLSWLEQWKDALQAMDDDENNNHNSVAAAYERMRLANPKYVLREWMLVDAYTDANEGMEAELFRLYELIQHPYDEGTASDIRKYYRRAPDEALIKGGTGFMS